MQTVDFSQAIQQIFITLKEWLSYIFAALGNIYIFGGLSLKTLLLILVVVGIIIDAIFVLIPTDPGD